MGEKEVKYFFDSYAVIEILANNLNYLPFKDERIKFSIFNLAEIYLHCISNDDLIVESDKIYDLFKKCLVEIEDETLKEAMEFKKENKKQRLSYADCVGYIYSKKHNMIFLTGDKEFENLPNVKFIKK